VLSVCALSSVGHPQDIPGRTAGWLPPAAADPDDRADEHAGSVIARPSAIPKAIAFRADPMLVITDTSPPAANGGAAAFASRLFYNL